LDERFKEKREQIADTFERWFKQQGRDEISREDLW